MRYKTYALLVLGISKVMPLCNDPSNISWNNDDLYNWYTCCFSSCCFCCPEGGENGEIYTWDFYASTHVWNKDSYPYFYIYNADYPIIFQDSCVLKPYPFPEIVLDDSYVNTGDISVFHTSIS